MGVPESDSADPILGMGMAEIPVSASESKESKEEPRVEAVFDTTPDGGLRAWLVVLGGFLTFFVTFGWS